jgi:hypothetical protein
LAPTQQQQQQQQQQRRNQDAEPLLNPWRQWFEQKRMALQEIVQSMATQLEIDQPALEKTRQLAMRTFSWWILIYAAISLTFTIWKWDAYSTPLVLHKNDRAAELADYNPEVQSLLIKTVQEKKRRLAVLQRERAAAAEESRRQLWEARQAQAEHRRAYKLQALSKLRAVHASQQIARAHRQRERSANQTTTRAYYLDRATALHDPERQAILAAFPILANLHLGSNDDMVETSVLPEKYGEHMAELTEKLKQAADILQQKKQVVFEQRLAVSQQKKEIVSALALQQQQRAVAGNVMVNLTLGLLPMDNEYGSQGRPTAYSSPLMMLSSRLDQFQDHLTASLAAASSTVADVTHALSEQKRRAQFDYVVGLLFGELQTTSSALQQRPPRHALDTTAGLPWADLTASFRSLPTTGRAFTPHAKDCAASVNQSVVEAHLSMFQDWYTAYIQNASTALLQDVPSQPQSKNTKIAKTLEKLKLHLQSIIGSVSAQDVGLASSSAEEKILNGSTCIKSADVIPWVEAGLLAWHKTQETLHLQLVKGLPQQPRRRQLSEAIRMSVLQRMAEEGRDTKQVVLDVAASVLSDAAEFDDSASSLVSMRQVLNTAFVVRSLPGLLDPLLSSVSGYNDVVDAFLDKLVANAAQAAAADATTMPTMGQALVLAMLQAMGHVPPLFLYR